MSHLEFGLVFWRGGHRDDGHVVHAGRYIAPCSERIYHRVFPHGARPPVVLGLGCDSRAVVTPPGLSVVEIVREPMAVVVRTAAVVHGHPQRYTQVVEVPLSADVVVTRATDAQMTLATREITAW